MLRQKVQELSRCEIQVQSYYTQINQQDLHQFRQMNNHKPSLFLPRKKLIKREQEIQQPSNSQLQQISSTIDKINPQKPELPIRKSTIRRRKKKNIEQIKEEVPVQTQVKHSSRSRKKQHMECPICFSNIPQNQLVYFSFQCLHYSCNSCLQQHIKSQIKRFKEIKCFEQRCPQIVDESSEIYHQLSLEQKEKYYKILIFKEVNKNPNQRLCPRDGCTGFMIIDQVPIQCIVCGEQFCPDCLFSRHRGPCDQNGLKFLENALQYKKCEKCRMVVQKNQGCNHMTCRCGYQFCYVCGGKWASNHVCNSYNGLSHGLNSRNIIRDRYDDLNRTRIDMEMPDQLPQVSIHNRNLISFRPPLRLQPIAPIQRVHQEPPRLNPIDISTIAIQPQINATGNQSQQVQQVANIQAQNQHDGCKLKPCLKKTLLVLVYLLICPLDLAIFTFILLILVATALVALHKALFFTSFRMIAQKICDDREKSVRNILQIIAYIVIFPIVWFLAFAKQFSEIVIPLYRKFRESQAFFFSFRNLTVLFEQ